MTRVLAVVEGATEERFARSVLQPHLAQRDIDLRAMQVLRGSGARGGGSSWQPWQKHLHHLLTSDRTAWVTTLIDLYAIPDDTPGWSPPGAPGPQRADRMLQAIAAAFPGQRQLLPYIQVHEYEALLYSDLEVVRVTVLDKVDEGDFASLVRNVAGQPPEDIDDDPVSAPSKRLLHAVPGFSKDTDGVLAAREIGIDRIRQACPRFNDWLGQLEAL